MVFEWVTAKFKQRQLQKAQIQAEADHLVIVSGLSILNPTWRTFFQKYPFYNKETDTLDLESLEEYITDLKYSNVRYHQKRCADCSNTKHLEFYKKGYRDIVSTCEQSELRYTESLELAYLKEVVNEVVGEYSEFHYSFDSNAKEFKEKLSDIIHTYYSFDETISNFENKIYQKNKEIERLQCLLDEKPVKEVVKVIEKEPKKDNRPITRNSKIYNKFKLHVLKRDEVCQCCGSTENLNVHHLSSYKYDKERRADTSNGIVLCKDCHTQFHSLYGKGHKNNPVNFAKFMREYGQAMQVNLDYTIKSDNIFEEILGGK